MIKKVKSLILRLWNRFSPFYGKLVEDNVFAIAGQSAFFLVLSSVPLFMFAVSVFQSLNIPIDVIESYIGLVMREEAAEKLAEYLNNMYENAVGISVITMIITLWSAAQGIHAITNGLNRVHKTYENRNWFVLRFRAMIYTVVFFVIILATIVLVVFGTAVNNLMKTYMEYLADIVSHLFGARFIIVFFFLVILFALAYRNLPNLTREQRKKYCFRCQLPGALFTAASWIILAWAIGIYVGDFNGYSIYGSLTRVAVVMIWLYFCMLCLMFGAEFNYMYHDRIDSVTGKLLHGKKRK